MKASIRNLRISLIDVEKLSYVGLYLLTYSNYLYLTLRIYDNINECIDNFVQITESLLETTSHNYGKYKKNL